MNAAVSRCSGAIPGKCASIACTKSPRLKRFPESLSGEISSSSSPAASEGRRTRAAGSGSGTVKWFNPTKGFGFIQPEGGGQDVFVHISAVEQAGLRGLNEGQLVAYDLEQDRRSGKTSATNLRVMG